MGEVDKTIKETTKPAVEAGKITLKVTEREILERIAPQDPGDAPSLKRKILETLFKKI